MVKRLTNQLINETVSELVGDDALKVIGYLKNRVNVSEFKIAEQIKEDVHVVRNILYRLHSHNLVRYYRKKDRQKGWYISYWTFNKKRVLELSEKLKQEKIKSFEERLKRELKNKEGFFLCPNACVRVDFSEAVELEFKCPECGALLKQMDNKRTIEMLKDKIKKLRSSG